MTAQCNLPVGFERGAALEVTTDPEELAQSLTEALMRDDLSAFGEAGRKLVEDRFSWSKVAAQHHEVYEWMLSRRDPPAFVQLLEPAAFSQ